MRQLDFYFVGHRATGKTTAGRLVGERLDWEFIDLDARIEQGEGERCAEIVARDEPRFRQLERDYLDRVRDEPVEGPRLIVLGGGFRPIPTDGIVLWLRRDGWRETAADERSAIDGSVDFETELDRMVREREPRWEERAHLEYEIPRCRGPERVADDLSMLLSWLVEAPGDPLLEKTFLISREREVERAFRDARLVGACGVELRSDLHRSGALDRPEDGACDILASLRTSEPEWLRIALAGGARAVDLDVDYLDGGLAVLDDHPNAPEMLLVSTHPESPQAESVERLESAARTAHRRLDVGPQRLVCKYAPTCASWADVRRGLAGAERLRKAGCSVTFLPQGDRFAGIRPRLARENATNYVPVGIGGDRPVPMSLGDWLPHLGLARPAHTEALIGAPVRHSQGARWHRSVSEREGEPVDYLNVRLGRGRADSELGDLLDLLRDLGVRGVSVTSPLKRHVVDREAVAVANELEAANTLVPSVSGSGDGEAASEARPDWRAFDTDRAGMDRAVDVLEALGVQPGRAAVIGRGGVSPAVRSAIDDSDWELALHASGREGWPSRADLSKDLALVVNAAGDSDRVYEDPPTPTAWIDLHYCDVRAAPEGVDVHLNGDAFFDAQAREQRRLWRDRGADDRDEDSRNRTSTFEQRENPP